MLAGTVPWVYMVVIVRVQYGPTYMGFTKFNNITIEYPGLLTLYTKIRRVLTDIKEPKHSKSENKKRK